MDLPHVCLIGVTLHCQVFCQVFCSKDKETRWHNLNIIVIKDNIRYSTYKRTNHTFQAHCWRSKKIGATGFDMDENCYVVHWICWDWCHSLWNYEILYWLVWVTLHCQLFCHAARKKKPRRHNLNIIVIKDNI